ncbi:MAG: glycerophosphodiester phosphodiesterase [Anaerolineae bacterium]|nr:glycerophosphodiester phosphodiesterase [Anaerolineae bacterium]
MAEFPATWWRERPLVFAHRGASHAAPENTLAAFQEALRLGADGIELDVHLSADGVPVVIHNAAVNATTDGRGLVNALSLAQLKALDAGSHFGVAFAGECIPTLAEVFEDVGRQLLINVELKAQSNATIELETAVAALVTRMGMANRLWFSSFRPLTLSRIRRLLPAVPCGLLYDVLGVATAFLTPLTPHEALHPHVALVNRRFVQRIHNRKQRIVTWTVDDIALARRMAAIGVDVLITNEPAEVLRALSA